MNFFTKIKQKRLQKYSCEKIYEKVKRIKRKSKDVLPSCVKNDFYLTKLNIKGNVCYNLVPKKNYCNEYIFYIYDSFLCFKMNKAQWDFIIEVSKKTGTGLVIPMYPLAPENSCEDVYDMIIKAYRDSSDNVNINKFSILGEGIGAGIALSLSIQIWKEGLRKPDKLIMLSPVLDTEFFDKKFEEKMKSFRIGTKFFFSEGVKEFVNKYWVANYATRTEFTSPIYEDVDDLCDNILVVSGTKDITNVYSRHIYSKFNRSGTPAKYFEYRNMPYEFYYNTKCDEAAHAKKVISDVLNDSGEAIFNKYMYEIKQRSEWSKKYPEIFKDAVAEKYLCNHKIPYKKYKSQTAFHKLLSAARQKGIDDSVRKFMMEYPNGTVVYVGCSLDTMFERTDNGRVLWYNCDSPGKIAVRRLYVSDKKREKTIDISINDRNWMEAVKCHKNQGLLFVCSDTLAYYKSNEAQEFMDRLYNKFEGCQVVFDVASYRSMLFTNVYSHGKESDYRKRRLYMNNPERSISFWNTSYRIINEKSILDGIDINPKWSGILKLKFIFARRFRDYKIVHIRLGNEKYETNAMI